MSRAAAIGVDGCRAGWIAVRLTDQGSPQVAIFRDFGSIVDWGPSDSVLAVDMPIGLPDHCGHGGRGPERLVRQLLGERQSSVFSIPSRAAIYATSSLRTEDWRDGHRLASAVARETSDPPRSVSIQAFGLFPKIRELDALLTNRPDLRARIFESHPEVAFWRLNGEVAMRLPKKVRGTAHPPGLSERRALLAGQGYAREFLDQPVPAGAGRDDFLDASALALVSRRIIAGTATPFPDPPGEDNRGLPVAIWA